MLLRKRVPRGFITDITLLTFNFFLDIGILSGSGSASL